MFRNRLPQHQPERSRRIFEDRMAEVFEELPALGGFYVDENLRVTELSIRTWPGADNSQTVAQELGQFLADLVDELPDAFEQLCGRTFARSLH